MKPIFVLLLGITLAHKLHTRSINLSEDMGQSLDDDIDQLMEKYDAEPKKQPKQAAAQKKAGGPGGPSVAEVQDMELKILQGNNLEEKSAKAEDDDLFQEVLDKYATKNGNDKMLKKEDAQEACQEVWQQKKGVDAYEAMD